MSTELAEPKEKKGKTFTKADWSAAAEYVIEEHRRRKSARTDVELKWEEVDRQIAMTPIRATTDSSWMPDLELGWQAQAHEALVADYRRLIFPSDREFFSAKAALVSSSDLRRLNFDGFAAGETATAKAIKARGEQSLADNLAVNMLQKFHQMYDFRRAVDELGGEATKYGVFVGQAKWVTEEVASEDFAGARPKRYPALVPCSMWNTYLDDSPAKLFAEGVHVGPGIVREYSMRVSDLRLAARRGSSSVTDPLGGWRPKEIETIDAALEKNNLRDHVKLIRFDGDLVVPRSGKESIYLPNVIVDVCEQGPVVIRYRERDLSFNPYIVGYYHRDDIRSPYASSPMIKGQPIQAAGTRALREWLACAALHARPPLRFNPYDPHYSKDGGPEVYPGVRLAANTNPDFLLVGDPMPIMAGFVELRRQYEEETGVSGTRLGQQTKSHQTAFAIDQENTRGMTRTVDFVSSSLNGALRSFLYMEYEMAKGVGEETIFIPDYNGFVTASGENLPRMVEFKIAGAGAPIDERERRNNELAGLQALIATAPAAKQAGGRVPDINAVQEDILRLAGIFDHKRYFPAPAGGGGVAPPAPIGAPIPGITAGIPAPPGQ